MGVKDRMSELGIALPPALAPAANYVPFRLSGNLLFVAGQVPFEGGEAKFLGTLGAGMSVEDGQAAARLCGLNVLAQADAALGGDLDRITGCLRLGVFVAATADFTRHPEVANGASDLIVEVLGDAGRHARAAVGTASLPRGVPVEVDAIFEVR